jgi:putative nucleotidyltransferase with HDIG domain
MDKLRVLFVDDDANVYRSLKRVIASRRAPLDILTASTAAGVMRIFEEEPCEVVVTDSKLPDMDGSGLLALVRDRWPGTLRILMTTETDNAVVSSLLGPAHQLLTKPATPEYLLGAIQSASGLRLLLMDERLREVTHRLEHLPVVPAIYNELTREVQKENYSNQSIARIISRDMSLTTALLKLLNTPFFGLSRSVDSMVQAVNILGVNLLRGLILSRGLFKPQDADMYPGFNTQRLWSHCLEMARCCRAVTQAEGAFGREAEDAFLAGLLHDVGKMVLAEGCPAEFSAILELSQSRNMPLFHAERTTLGITHAQIGGYLLGLWGFPESVVLPVAQHHGLFPGLAFTRLSAVLHTVDVTLHNRYVRVSGHSPHDLDADILKPVGEDGVHEKWASAALEQFDAAQ